MVHDVIAGVLLLLFAVAVVLLATRVYAEASRSHLPLAIAVPGALYTGWALFVYSAVLLVLGAVLGDKEMVTLVDALLVNLLLPVGFFFLLRQAFHSVNGKVPVKKAVEQPEHR